MINTWRSGLVSILLFASVAQAESRFGWALLAFQHRKFPCKKVDIYTKAAPSPYVSVLWDSFGTKTKCLKRFVTMSGTKSHTIEIYMSNEVGRRKGNLASYEFLPNLSVSEYNNKLEKGNKRVIKRVRKKAKGILKKCMGLSSPTTTCLISIGLESQYSEKAARRLVTEVASIWGADSVIHNPVGMASYQGRAGANYRESHGLHTNVQGARNIVSLDGETPDLCPPGGLTIGRKVSDAEMRSWQSRYRGSTDFAANWCPMHQGLKRDSVAVPPPRQRVLRVTNGEFIRYNGLMGFSSAPGPPAPGKYHTKGCTNSESWGNGSLIKESDHGGVVVVLSPKFKKRFGKVLLVSPDGGRSPLRFSGFANPINGKDRQHWRDTNSPYNSFKNKLVMKAKGLTGTYCWKIPKAGTRYG